MRVAIVLAALTLVAFAGCLSGNSNEGNTPAPNSCPAGPFDQPGLRILPTTDDPIDDGRENATNFETTNVRTCSLPAIGWTALSPDGTPHKYLGEIDMRADLGIGAVAVVGSGEVGRVYLLDITTPAKPTMLSVIPLVGAYVTDVKISDDGKILYAASQATPTAELATANLPNLIAASGFTAYNIENRGRPIYLGFVEDVGTGCHMLDPVQVAANQDAVMCVSNLLRSYLIQRDGTRLINLGFVDFVPVNDLSNVAAAQETVAAIRGAPHDMTAYHTDGAFGSAPSYLIVSYWDLGLKVLDITDAPVIVEVGSWNGQGATHFGGNVHTAMMFHADGHRYIIASSEYTQQGVVPGLWVLDADDLSNLKLIAQWYHPGLHPSQGLYLTTHQWQVAPTGSEVSVDDVNIYLTYNHAGIWVLDFGAILRGEHQNAILGYNLARTPLPEGHVSNAVLATWDVNVADGYIYGSDRATGLWIFHYQGDAGRLGDKLGDQRLRGFA